MVFVCVAVVLEFDTFVTKSCYCFSLCAVFLAVQVQHLHTHVIDIWLKRYIFNQEFMDIFLLNGDKIIFLIKNRNFFWGCIVIGGRSANIN